jgi:hypothetical protein
MSKFIKEKNIIITKAKRKKEKKREKDGLDKEKKESGFCS